MKRDQGSSLTIAGHEGQLRTVSQEDQAIVPQWLWEGLLDGPGVVAVVRSLLRTGSFPCGQYGVPHRGVAASCWYDAGRGAVVLELMGPPERLA